jgi:hypothetical protein
MYRMCQQVSPVIHFTHRAMGEKIIAENRSHAHKTNEYVDVWPINIGGLGLAVSICSFFSTSVSQCSV